MSSAACPKEAELQNITGRVSSLESQHRTMLDLQAQTLAEVRELRQSFSRYSQAVAEELQRVYQAVLAK